MRPHVIARYVGMVMLLNAAFMLIAFLISLINHDDGQLPLLFGAILTALWGIFPIIFVPKTTNLSYKESYLIMALSWIISCLMGTLPFLFWGDEFNLVYALFESVSGYTTTGATILSNVEALPSGLLFFRSSMHWIGGIGIIVFMLLILPSLGKSQMTMAKMEISSLSHDHFKFKTRKMLKIILSVYFGITSTCTILLIATGMSPFDAINHAFSIVATGGFSTKTASIGYYNSISIEMVVCFFMLISGIHFGLIYTTLAFKKANIFTSPIVRYFCLSVAIGIVLVTFFNHGTTYSTWGQSIRHSTFQVIAASSTAGFATANTAVWPPRAIAILLYLTLQGACSGSTTGGMKFDRVAIFLKSLRCHLLKVQHPHAVIPVKFGKRVLKEDVVDAAILFIAIYITIIFISTLCITAMGVDLMTAFSASTATMGNAGAGFGLVGTASNYSCLPGGAILVLCVDMLLGRLEIFGLLMLFVIRSWK